MRKKRKHVSKKSKVTNVVFLKGDDIKNVSDKFPLVDASFRRESKNKEKIIQFLLLMSLHSLCKNWRNQQGTNHAIRIKQQKTHSIRKTRTHGMAVSSPSGR